MSHPALFDTHKQPLDDSTFGQNALEENDTTEKPAGIEPSNVGFQGIDFAQLPYERNFSVTTKKHAKNFQVHSGRDPQIATDSWVIYLSTLASDVVY
jgi:hypothetical protein